MVKFGLVGIRVVLLFARFSSEELMQEEQPHDNKMPMMMLFSWMRMVGWVLYKIFLSFFGALRFKLATTGSQNLFRTDFGKFSVLTFS